MVVIYYTAVNLFSLLIISYTGVAEDKDQKGPRRPQLTPPLTMKTRAFSTNAQSRSPSVVLDGFLGPLHLVQHT